MFEKKYILLCMCYLHTNLFICVNIFLLMDIPLSVSWYFLFFDFASFFAGLFISDDVFHILLNFSQLGLRLLIEFLVLFQTTRLKMEHEERMRGLLPGEMKQVGFL